MRQVLIALGLLILVTGLKAAAWVANNGAPPTPETAGDYIGLGFVVAMLVAFVGCSIWYLVKGGERPSARTQRDPQVPTLPSGEGRNSGSVQL